MIKMLELREMIRLVDKSAIQEFNLKNGGIRISMRKPLPSAAGQKAIGNSQEIIQTALNEAAASLESVYPESNPAEPQLKDEAKEPQLHTIVSPVIGVFSSSPAPGAEPYVKVGDMITPDSIVCSCNVDALRLVHEITGDINGEIVEVLVEDGQFVEYGQPLFLAKEE